MADKTQQTTRGVLGDIKSAARGIKGAGDAIRGTFNESLDTAFNEPEGEVKNKNIAEKGIADMKATDNHFSGHPGVESSGGSGLRTGGIGTGTTTTGTRTDAGAHSGGIGNMQSNVPQRGLGGEPTRTTERY